MTDNCGLEKIKGQGRARLPYMSGPYMETREKKGLLRHRRTSFFPALPLLAHGSHDGRQSPPVTHIAGKTWSLPSSRSAIPNAYLL